MENENQPHIIYKGKFRHKRGCMSGIVNPVTEWVGGGNVVITGYECPECKEITYDRQF